MALGVYRTSRVRRAKDARPQRNNPAENPPGCGLHLWVNTATDFPAAGTRRKPMLTKIFPNNEATFDRVLRVLLGVAALSLVFIGPQTRWGLLGLVPLITGLVGSCPVYTLLGFSTCPMKKLNA